MADPDRIKWEEELKDVRKCQADLLKEIKEYVGKSTVLEIQVRMLEEELKCERQRQSIWDGRFKMDGVENGVKYVVELEDKVQKLEDYIHAAGI